MNTELVFRISLLVLFISFVAHRGYYSRKMGNKEKQTIKQRDENLVSRIAGLMGLAAFAATLVYVIYPPWMAWAALPLPDWARWLGIGIALAGFGLLQWAHWALGKNWSDTPKLLQGQQLVTEGPYRWIRHPIYTAFLIVMGSTLLISANWFIGAMWFGMTALEVWSRIQYEENLMLETFGAAYREQMQHTGRLLPRVMN